MKIETYVCAGCSAVVERPAVRGQRPKWCPGCRARSAWGLSTFRCQHCGKTVTGTGAKFCSTACCNRANGLARRKPKPAPTRPTDQRGPLRRAYEDGDAPAFFAALAREAETSSGCWIWKRVKRDGYPVARFGAKDFPLHRLVLEMKHGGPLGSQHAHHVCATSACVNPEHLQPITHRDNIAEMLARQSYLARIRDLEAALSEIDPTHRLLGVVSVA